MLNKFLLFLIIITLLILAASAFIFLNQATIEPTMTMPLTPPTTTSSISPPPPTLSEKELTKLWANGERCPTKDFIPPKFASWGKRDDIIEINNLQVFVNSINVNFTSDATCKDAERVAQFINAKIIYFKPTANIYGFEIPTRTKEELDAAMNKIKSLNDPKIEMDGVNPSYPFIKYPPFVP